MTTTGTFHRARADAFAARLLANLNGAAMCLMASIGHRAGLFDAMRGQPAASPDSIAERAGLHPRYVREWLGAMATSGVIEVDRLGLYRLPDEHAAFLTRAAGADNLAVFTQYVAVLGGVEDDVLRCFREGGGVPYARYGRFHEVMAEDSGQSVVSSLDEHILPLVPGLKERLEGGIRVLDAGCGSGRVLLQLAASFPASTFHGLDLSPETIASARADAERRGLGNVTFEVRDLADFDRTSEPAAYDLVTTFDAVHDQPRPLSLLRGLHRALRDDGVYLMQEIKGSSHVHENLDHPIGPFLYTISCMHCMTVSLAQGGEGLGAMWGEQKARAYLAEAGFGSVEKRELAHDIQNDWYVVRKDASS
jgi:2-polyprenyl-3-methyl-5-hydroxy-6-metoxy-1,4-benzoquinol methylase